MIIWIIYNYDNVYGWSRNFIIVYYCYIEKEKYVNLVLLVDEGGCVFKWFIKKLIIKI